MNEGILNRVGRFLWNKSVGWEGLDPRLWGGSSPSEDGMVEWNDYAAHLKMYTGTVYTCVRLNSTNFASVPLCLYAPEKRTGNKGGTRTQAVPMPQKRYLLDSPDIQAWLQKEGAVDLVQVVDPLHPGLKILRHVNNRFTRHDLFEKTMQFLELHGECFWKLDLGNSGKPQNIWFLRPQDMDIKEDGKGGIEKFVQKVQGGDNIEYDPKEVIHFWYPGPFSEYRGCSPLVAAGIAGNIEQKIQVYTHNTFDNMGVPRLAITSEKRMSDEQFDRIKKQLDMKAKGYRNANSNIAIEGAAKLEELGFGPHEMEFIDGSKTARQWVANAYGIPISILDDENSNRATSMSGDRRYWRSTMLPKFVRVQEELTESLAPFYDDALIYAFKDPVPEDAVLKSQQRKSDLTIKGINEVRADESLEPIEGGDPVLVSGTMIPVEMAGQPKEVPIQEAADKIISQAVFKAKQKGWLR